MNSKKINRRDFLKILGASSLFYPVSRAAERLKLNGQMSASGKPNFLIVIFDALTARHVGFHGYQRNTTPNIDAFAKQSTVYYRHYSSSNYTKPAVSSLFSGAQPWSHRAFIFYTAMREFYSRANLFGAMPAEYYNIAFTHNHFVSAILEEVKSGLDFIKPMEELALYNPNAFPNAFKNDAPMGFYASKRWRDDYIGPSNSLFINPISKVMLGFNAGNAQAKYKDLYPLGLSDNMEGYLYKLEDLIDWLGQSAADFPAPYLGYFHALPPHEEYKPRADFLGKFANDGVRMVEKPPHFFTLNQTQAYLEEKCRLYDEYIALVDAEFARLYQQLEASGALENTYLILTSDHGQGFERGIHGHNQPVLYETNIHIPLIIHAPGQKQGKEIFSPTSIVDVMPTLLHLAGQPAPEWSEGELLPHLGGVEDPQRMIFSMEAKSNYKMKPMTKATLSVIQMPYKLITYKGYPGFDNIDELFDLENDPEELNNIAAEKPSITAALKEALQKSLDAAEEKSLNSP